METNRTTENENMTTCNSCGNSVSVNATTCPYCGNNELKKTSIICQDYKNKNRKLMKNIGLVGVIFNIILFFANSGAIPLFFGVFFFYMFMECSGKEKQGICPHCNKEITFGENEKTVKCNACGKESAITEKCLIGK